MYDHTQTAPLYLVLIAIAIVMLGGAWYSPEPVVEGTLLASGALLLFLAAGFRQLSIRDAGDHLHIAFGPLPLFQRRIRYADLEQVARGRTTVLDGWGIHLSPSGGWTWNLWGRDCVDLWYQGGRKIRLGTDDPGGLEAFLRTKVS